MNKGFWVDELIDYLLSESCTVQDLDFTFNFVNSREITRIFEALQLNKTISYLNLSENVIGINSA